mgnify:CR=1 FL=1
MSILIWFLIGFLVYSFVVVPVFMELSLGRPKKTKDGRLCIKRGWVIRFFYGINIARKIKDNDFRFPKNTCQLYKGIYLGIPCFFLIPTFTFVLISVCFVMLFGVAGPFVFIAGFLPNPVGFAKKGNEPFYPYEEIGDKKWIAPWKFILPIGLAAFICFFYREIFVSLVKISYPLSSNTALIIYGSVAGLVFLVIVINKIRKIESFVAGKETVISFLKKMCKEIEIRE